MAGLSVTFVQADGQERTIEAVAPGSSLMEIGRSHGVAGILGDCGGSCACATCHVYVEPDWQAAIGAADAIETTTLDMAMAVQANSRLCCQIAMRPELHGLRLRVAPAY